MRGSFVERHTVRPSRRSRQTTLRVTTLFAGLSMLGSAGPGRAADHLDGPMVQADPAADLGDLYAWSTDEGTLIVALTFAPGLSPGGGEVVDPEVLYSIHFETLADEPEQWVIRTRFGENMTTGEWGVQVRYLPGAGSDLVGPLHTTLQGDGVTRAWAGLVEDPFFADLEGLMATLDSGTLSFDADRDALAGLEAMAIVLELDPELIVEGNAPLRVWATAGRAP